MAHCLPASHLSEGLAVGGLFSPLAAVRAPLSPFAPGHAPRASPAPPVAAPAEPAAVPPPHILPVAVGDEEGRASTASVLWGATAEQPVDAAPLAAAAAACNASAGSTGEAAGCLASALYATAVPALPYPHADPVAPVWPAAHAFPDPAAAIHAGHIPASPCPAVPAPLDPDSAYVQAYNAALQPGALDGAPGRLQSIHNELLRLNLRRDAILTTRAQGGPVGYPAYLQGLHGVASPTARVSPAPPLFGVPVVPPVPGPRPVPTAPTVSILNVDAAARAQDRRAHAKFVAAGASSVPSAHSVPSDLSLPQTRERRPLAPRWCSTSVAARTEFSPAASATTGSSPVPSAKSAAPLPSRPGSQESAHLKVAFDERRGSPSPASDALMGTVRQDSGSPPASKPVTSFPSTPNQVTAMPMQASDESLWESRSTLVRQA